MPTPPLSFVARALAALTLLGSFASALPAQDVMITLKAWREPVRMDTLRQDHHLRASPAQVYEAALKAYAELGIPTGQTDGKRGIIGSERFERTQSLMGIPLSRSFSCGDSPAGPNADFFRLEIAVATWVVDAKPGTTLGVASIASGRDISGVNRNPRPCTSTGKIELKLLEAITKIVGG